MEDVPMSFFGFELEPNKPYVHTPPEGVILKVAQAALATAPQEGERVQLSCQYEDKTLAICNFIGGRVEHCALSLEFPGGSEFKFIVKGKTGVHVTGFYQLFDDDMSEEDFDEEEYMKQLALAEGVEDSDEDSEEDSEDEGEPKLISSASGVKFEELNSEEDSDEDSEEDSDEDSEEEAPKPKVGEKRKPEQKQAPQKKQKMESPKKPQQQQQKKGNQQKGNQQKGNQQKGNQNKGKGNQNKGGKKNRK